MLEKGAQWSIDREYGHPHDLQYTEASGYLHDANAAAASKRALEREKTSWELSVQETIFLRCR